MYFLQSSFVNCKINDMLLADLWHSCAQVSGMPSLWFSVTRRLREAAALFEQGKLPNVNLVSLIQHFVFSRQIKEVTRSVEPLRGSERKWQEREWINKWNKWRKIEIEGNEEQEKKRENISHRINKVVFDVIFKMTKRSKRKRAMLSPYIPWRRMWELDVYFHLLLTSAVVGGQQSASSLVSPVKELQYLSNRRLGGSQTGLESSGE